MGLNIKLIDEQHKKLLNIINQLATSIENNSQKNDIAKIIDDLIYYSEYHFKTEEKLFDKYKYEDSVSHVNDHERFVNKFITLKESITKRKNAIEISQDTLDFIVDWFINHIIESDRKYLSLFKEHGIE